MTARRSCFCTASPIAATRGGTRATSPRLSLAGVVLILIDQRGHGASDAPHRREDYSGALRAADVIAVLDALGLQQADIFGYSMGGWCALNVAASHPDRVGRLVVGGSHPFAQSLSFYRNALRSKAVWSGIMLALGGSLTPDWQARIRQNDVEALRAAVAEDRPDISGSLKTFPRDCLFYVGSKDLAARVRRARRSLDAARRICRAPRLRPHPDVPPRRPRRSSRHGLPQDPKTMLRQSRAASAMHHASQFAPMALPTDRYWRLTDMRKR